MSKSDWRIRKVSSTSYAVYYGTECYSKGWRKLESAQAYVDERIASAAAARRARRQSRKAA